MDTKDWLIAWFQKNGSTGKEDAREHTADNYFGKGWIDSFAFIAFISDMEDHFKVQFDNAEFQDREFSTIDGLATIIEKKLHAKK